MYGRMSKWDRSPDCSFFMSNVQHQRFQSKILKRPMRFLAKANVAHFLDSPPLLSSVRVSNIVVLMRYSNTNFICPRFNRMIEGGRLFAVTTCQLWNSLSRELRNSASTESFTNNYRNNLFNIQQKLHHFIV